MKRALASFVAIAALASASGAGYWWGRRTPTPPDGGSASVSGAPSQGSEKAPRKILYYRNPMGLPDRSPSPKKDPMGMDYIAVYEGEESDARGSHIQISVEKVQKLGVRSEPATLRALGKVIAAAGRIEVDERRLFEIAPKFEGWVERLFVNATGQHVSKGQPLFEVYSPELVSAQREYAIASQAVAALKSADADPRDSMQRLADSSLARLRNWDISDEQIRSLAQTGETRRTLVFRSPASGIVLERKAVQGMRFMPGDTLYQVADLSVVWVIADVYEQDIGMVRTGGMATVRINAYPGQRFEGRIAYVYPTLNAETRTVPVRLEVANPRTLLKPAMFAQVDLPVGRNAKVLTVPVSAVIDSGTRQIVLVRLDEGRFEPREVRLGTRTDKYVEVTQGVQDGEQVVVAANFLIDAESNLRAAVSGFGHAAHGGTGGGKGEPGPSAAAAPRPAGSGSAKGAMAEAPLSRAPGGGHRAVGIVQAIDAGSGSVSVAHDPVESLKWPAMTMDFNLANEALLAGLKRGAPIAFEFVERAPGEWVITRITPRNTAGPDAKPATHQGH